MAKKRDAADWAEETFAAAELGDARLTERLVKVAADMAKRAGMAPCRASADAAAVEGSYRLLRNPRVSPHAVREGGFRATSDRAASVEELLAIEDTTTLAYPHAAPDGLGDLGGPPSSEGRGFFVHSVLLVNGRNDETVGLIEQEYWTREPKARGQRHQRRKRAYQDKESFKWRRASERVRERLGDEVMARTISVCDREADVYEYLSFKVARQERFIVRAAWDRNIEVDNSEDEQGHAIDPHLFAVMGRAKKFGEAVVHVPQRGGRPARNATLSVRAVQIRLRRPHRLSSNQAPKHIVVNAVLAREEAPPAKVEPLEWLLFTSEPIATAEQVLDVLRHYRLRWRIEDFHKAWKSGAGVERRRMQTPDNLQRIAAILSFVAVRLLQLRERHDREPDGSCDSMLTATEWKVLWVTIEKRRPPRKPPTIAWAHRAIGRLGGWHDSKRNGRVGWDSYWLGWSRLQERVEGYDLARSLDGAP